MAVANVELQVNGRGATKELNRVNAAVGKLQSAAIKLGGAFAGIQAFKFIFAKTAELETQTRSLKVLTGSLENAKKIIKELQDFGAVTPFTSAELIETSKRLKAFGVETSKLVDTTKRLGDIAGATGADLSGIATAYGQIQAKGKLQTEELLQLQERGVDLASVLKKEYGLTGEEFSKALQKGQISAEAAEFALKKLTDTGGQYANGAIAQSDTLSGLMSTLQDNVARLAQQIGNTLAPALKNITRIAIEGLNFINKQFEAAGLANKFGLKGPALLKIAQQADKEAEGFVKRRDPRNRMSGFEKSGLFNRLRQERLNDLLKKYGYETGLLQPEISVPSMEAGTIPPLLGGTTNIRGGRTGTGKTEAEKAAEKRLELERSLTFEAQEQVSNVKAIIEDRRIENELLQLELDKGKEFADTTREIRELVMDGVPFSEAFKLVEANQLIDEQIKKQKELQEAQKAAAAEMDQLYGAIGDSIQTGIVDSLTAAVEGTKSLAEVASDTLKSLANIMLKFGLQTFLGGLGGGDPNNIFTKLFGGGRASGGTVKGGTSYLVGERGPELFTPGRSGSIAPNNAMGGANVTVNVDASGSSVQGDGQNAAQLGKVIGLAVQTELRKQQRPGGILAR